MKKDVVYIDIEDDITAIIDKLKNSSEKIVALVPPKGNQVMQSVVNLKLLKRAAEQTGKQPVVVTSSKALSNLAGGLGMYTAKNLQSKPALAESSKLDAEIDDEPVEVSDSVHDISDNEVAVESAATTGVGDEMELSEDEMKSLEAEDAGSAASASPAEAKKSTKGSKSKIPNFDKFKKRLLIGLAVLLLLFVAWIFTFGRTRANIAIRAETTPVDVALDSTVSADLPQTDPAKYAIKAQYQESKKTISQAFVATGQKDLGTKATGQVSLRNCSNSDNDITIPAGTGVSANNLTFLTDKAVSLPASSFSGGRICRTPAVAVGVTAQNNGDQYNLAPQPYTVAGVGGVTSSGTQMSGGTSQIVKVIAQADVDKAKEQVNQLDSSSAKEELKKTFGPDVKILEDSFVSAISEAHSEPAVGEQVNEGKLTAQVTYSILAVSNDDVKEAVKAFIATKMADQGQQKAYEDSIKNIKFERTGGDARNGNYKISSQGQFGPKFDLEKLKKEIVGKKAGEIRSQIDGLPGVKGVDINFWPIWASKAPSADRINIKVDVDTNIGG